jgi:hypothetical protein
MQPERHWLSSDEFQEFEETKQTRNMSLVTCCYQEKWPQRQGKERTEGNL